MPFTVATSGPGSSDADAVPYVTVTLDQARDIVRDAIGTSAPANYAATAGTDSLTDTGGTLGPLPNGRTIVVRHITWRELEPALMTDELRPATAALIVKAYNARVAGDADRDLQLRARLAVAWLTYSAGLQHCRRLGLALAIPRLQAFVAEHPHIAEVTVNADYESDKGVYFVCLSGSASLVDDAPADASGEDEAIEFVDELGYDGIDNAAVMELFGIDDVGSGTLTRQQIAQLETDPDDVPQHTPPPPPRTAAELIAHLATLPPDTPVLAHHEGASALAA